MKVLVHYDVLGERAYGIWWQDPVTGSPQSLYMDPDGPYATRAKMIVFGKQNPDVSWGDWFDTLTTRAPYTETWVTYDSMGFTPPELLSALEPAPRLVS